MSRKTIYFVIIAMVLVLVSGVALSACNSSLQDEINKLQQKVDGYEADFEEKSVVIFIGEKRFDLTTRKAYLHQAIKDLYEEGKISVYEYGDDDLNPYVTAIDNLVQNFENNKYYSVWHNVEVFSLKGLNSSWGNPGRAVVEDDGYGNMFVVTNYAGHKLYYSAVGMGILSLIDGGVYAVLVD